MQKSTSRNSTSNSKLFRSTRKRFSQLLRDVGLKKKKIVNPTIIKLEEKQVELEKKQEELEKKQADVINTKVELEELQQTFKTESMEKTYLDTLQEISNDILASALLVFGFKEQKEDDNHDKLESIVEDQVEHTPKHTPKHTSESTKDNTDDKVIQKCYTNFVIKLASCINDNSDTDNKFKISAIETNGQQTTLTISANGLPLPSKKFTITNSDIKAFILLVNKEINSYLPVLQRLAKWSFGDIRKNLLEIEKKIDTYRTTCDQISCNTNSFTVNKRNVDKLLNKLHSILKLLITDNTKNKCREFIMQNTE